MMGLLIPSIHSPALVVVQTFEMVFVQYIRHAESKGPAPDGTACKAHTHGLLKRYPIEACGFHLIGKQMERGWEQAEDISTLRNSLNPYDRSTVGQILKIEDCNKDRRGHQHQLYGLAISAKRYVVYTRHTLRREIIKSSEHGLGMVYVPDERKRYKPVDCEDQETNYPRWIVEAWERLLDDHCRTTKDPENALVAQELWFAHLPAMMRIRVTRRMS